MGGLKELGAAEHLLQPPDYELFESAATLKSLTFGTLEEVVGKFHGGAHTYILLHILPSWQVKWDESEKWGGWGGEGRTWGGEGC